VKQYAVKQLVCEDVKNRNHTKYALFLCTVYTRNCGMRHAPETPQRLRASAVVQRMLITVVDFSYINTPRKTSKIPVRLGQQFFYHFSLSTTKKDSRLTKILGIVNIVCMYCNGANLGMFKFDWLKAVRYYGVDMKSG